MTNFEKVRLFMTTFGQEVKNKASLSSENINNLRINLIEEELNEFKEAFNQLNIITYDQFINSDKSEGLVSGTIMAIQEKKSAKGTPYGFVKFSDNKGEFELFLFSEILISNRERLKVSEPLKTDSIIFLSSLVLLVFIASNIDLPL